MFDIVVDCIFGLDILLNFVQSYKHPETYENITDLKSIAKNYTLKGWFVIDFLSTFPFGLFLNSGQVTKLLRLLRLPRIIKLIDISRFSKLLESFLSNQSRDEKILLKYMLLYFYKIFRLIIIAVIITYFIGCFWWLLSSSLHTEAD